MPEGLLRNNNLSDLPDRDQAVRNLGLDPRDVVRIRGVAYPGGVTAANVQRIANSSGNFQQQIDTQNQDLNTIDPSAYVLRAGDTISGTWQNSGLIKANVLYSGISNRVPPSSDSLFSHNRDGQFELTATTINYALGLNTAQITDYNNTIMSGVLTPNKTFPMKINGVLYNLEACAL
jgi:hypothetical protein